MADTIDPVTGKVILNLITRTHVSRVLLQSLLTALIKSTPQLGAMIVEDLERRRGFAKDADLRDYMELAISDVMEASVAASAK